jgi:hypothetical protein
MEEYELALLAELVRLRRRARIEGTRQWGAAAIARPQQRAE